MVCSERVKKLSFDLNISQFLLRTFLSFTDGFRGKYLEATKQKWVTFVQRVRVPLTVCGRQQVLPLLGGDRVLGEQGQGHLL
jgi:hypothetical protein